jgi:hypothetical protein
MEYRIHRCDRAPTLDGNREEAAWRTCEAAPVNAFRPESSDHRPSVEARLVYADRALHGLFTVRDRYVRCTHTRFGDPVCRDSCVEFFAQPHGSPGYINFEFNCGGTLLASWITDHRRTPDGFAAFRRLTEEECGPVRVYHSMPAVVDPEIQTPVDWAVQFAIPLAVFERHTGPLEVRPGTTWRGNFYKCADESSHPHWAAWSPVDELNFHLPRCFGTLRFE